MERLFSKVLDKQFDITLDNDDDAPEYTPADIAVRLAEVQSKVDDLSDSHQQGLKHPPLKGPQPRPSTDLSESGDQKRQPKQIQEMAEKLQQIERLWQQVSHREQQLANERTALTQQKKQHALQCAELERREALFLQQQAVSQREHLLAEESLEASREGVRFNEGERVAEVEQVSRYTEQLGHLGALVRKGEADVQHMCTLLRDRESELLSAEREAAALKRQASEAQQHLAHTQELYQEALGRIEQLEAEAQRSSDQCRELQAAQEALVATQRQDRDTITELREALSGKAAELWTATVKLRDAEHRVKLSEVPAGQSEKPRDMPAAPRPGLLTFRRAKLLLAGATAVCFLALVYWGWLGDEKENLLQRNLQMKTLLLNLRTELAACLNQH
eukprot:NODE_2090_length_1282_cov_101.059740_g1989_i0.p1 GENE.NODE_2090_length_1282_cov_101.059740_g1989_i0~~NODE_2090_length_1282_cov_101.059740_g1989_i0.p1  ORF type:complete len:390 (+),score=106.78 NODE_2090_length_1282_cov_101.059740_g1989_i0:59-1228(+)